MATQSSVRTEVRRCGRSRWFHYVLGYIACGYLFIAAAFSQSKCAQGTVELKSKNQASDYGILRSGDNGSTWMRVVNDSGAIQTMIENSSGGILAGTLGAISGPKMHLGLLRSDDGGMTWKRASTCSNGEDLSDIRTIVRLSEGHLLAGGGAGFLRSDDNGSSWAHVNQPGPAPSVQYLVATEQDVAFAATYDGVLRLDKNLTSSPAGLKGVPINVVLLSRSGVLFVGSRKGVQRSTDGGRTWRSLLSLGQSYVSAMTADFGGNMYAGVVDQGVYRSNDGGVSWKRLQTPGTKPQIYALAAGIHGDVFVAIGGNVLRSTDSGSTWTRILELHLPDVAVGSILITRKGILLVGLNSVGE